MTIGASDLLLANKIFSPFDGMTAGRLWFIEVLVWILVLLTILLAVPAVDRVERRRPFAFAVVFLAAGVALVMTPWAPTPARTPGSACWRSGSSPSAGRCSRATTAWQRVAVTALLAIGLHGYFGEPVREA